MAADSVAPAAAEDAAPGEISSYRNGLIL
jgi:hypothetical protein